jgi:hypothetical protein
METIQDFSSEVSNSTVACAELGIDREYIARMLDSLGVDLSHTLAPSMILCAFDVMACAQLALHLPPAADFKPVLQDTFHSFIHEQPERVRAVQVQVLDAVHAVTPLSDARYTAMLEHLYRYDPVASEA